MSHLQLCGISLRQLKTGVSINHQWIELGLLSQCCSLCMEQYAGIHAISSKIMLSNFSYALNCKSHNLDKTTWLHRTMWLEKLCLLFLFELHQTMDQVMWLATGLHFHSAILVTTSWSCSLPFGPHWFHSKSLFWPLVLVPSHLGLATFCPCSTHSLVLT